MPDVGQKALKRKNESLQIRSSDPLLMPRLKKIKKGTTLGSSLGPDYFVGGEEDQVSSLPPSWFGPELMSFFRYADVFSDVMEIDPATAEEKFVPDWDIRKKDSVMDELVPRTLLFNISTPLDHARSRKMKSQGLSAMVLSNQAQSNVLVTELYRRWVEAESVRENLEKEARSLKRKIQRTPKTEKKIAQLTLDLQAQHEKVKSLTTQSQSSQAAAASAAEDRDRIAAELKGFSESMQKKDEEHKAVLAKMEESFTNARLAYANMMAARLLAKNIHKGPEMTTTVAAVNNAMSVVDVNSGLHNGYLHALKKKTPYAEVPMLNRNVAEVLNAVVACFDSLAFPVVEDLPKLVNEPLSKIKAVLSFASGESSKE
ncbi:hypothetical protein HanRHA438_Chr16g0763631 [Helianthus annuus]|nr:hypothetical protein HanRHA438_Chr16g0763631 [Helianthus annuus]